MNDFFKDVLAEYEIEPLDIEAVEPTVVTPKEWKPQPRIQTPHKENSDPATFKVGTWEQQRPGKWIRLALPHPRFPEPGAIASDEIARVYDAQCALALEAEIVMRQYLFYVKFRALYSADYFNDISHGLAAERIAWLKGVWSSRVRCPDENEFVAMAIETPPKD